MKAKKLIEVAMPIKEISAESVRDKSIRRGHISTLHLWWARRPLPACRAIVFGSLVPDPDDPACPQAFKDAVAYLLKNEDPNTNLMYKPYKDIPYTAIVDPMDDTLRHRLMMFVGMFSDVCQENMIAGKSTPPKDQLSDGSLIKWENKNNPKILNKARELIFVAYNAESSQEYSFESLHREYKDLASAITKAEEALYSVTNRHIPSAETHRLEKRLHDAIEEFQNRMPSVFDPFAGGGAIPLEAARLGCRSYGNDINPVAHIIERGSAEFPQKYGKPITFSESEFDRLYGERGRLMLKGKSIFFTQGEVEIPNRLAWDVEFYARLLVDKAYEKSAVLYDNNSKDKPLVYYWVRTAKCSNPSCQAEVPMLKQFYISKRRNSPSTNWIYLNPVINGTSIDFEIKRGNCNLEGWNNRCVLTCPCCGNITDAKNIKKQFHDRTTGVRLVAVISEEGDTRKYRKPTIEEINTALSVEYPEDVPNELLPKNDSQNLKVPLWGYKSFGSLFTRRQLHTINILTSELNDIRSSLDESEYAKSIISYLAIFIDKVICRNSAFGIWHKLQETVEHPFGRQALPMVFDFPEMNPFSSLSGACEGQIQAVVDFIECESGEFPCVFNNTVSGNQKQFNEKQLDCVVTDPPYYDAISYADLSDFFYVWLKRMLKDVFPINFSTPLTPKVEECTAIKHRFNGDYDKAKKHFEDELTSIFDAIEIQTRDIVSIMFAHQSTEAWTTLCNSILDARMNITGSWPIDTEVAVALKAAMATLESSVTVACRPNERKGFEEYKVVEHAIKDKVKEEVEKLYELGFRGADLLTACFGQAVSEFGKYKVVERADGKQVTVAELLELARQTAFDTLLKGIKADEFTRFYIGWLQMNGMGETNHDDVTKFTRVGVSVDIHEVIQEGLLVSNGSKNHLASAEEHLKQSVVPGTLPSHPIIDQVHRAILFNRKQNNEGLLKLIRECAPTSDASFWRVLASLKEMLPAGKDLTDVQELLRTADYLRTKCKEKIQPKQGSLFD